MLVHHVDQVISSPEDFVLCATRFGKAMVPTGVELGFGVRL
jgi:hypothetical protein